MLAKQNAVILSNFQEYYLSQPVEQTRLLTHLAFMMATAKCVEEKVSSQEKADEILNDIRAQVNKYGVSPRWIQSRQYNFLPNQDSNHDNNQFSLTHNNILKSPSGINLDQRMHLYEQAVKKIAQQIYLTEDELPNSIVHTTCTGYLSPSPIQKFLSEKNWLHPHIIHAYHMGCYAAIPTVEIGVGLLASQYVLANMRKRVDMIHTEISSLHLNTRNLAPNNIVDMTLFGDGFIKYSAYLWQEFVPLKKRGLKILAAESMLIKESSSEMTWVPGPFQFEMYLSKNVPILIGENITVLLEKLCRLIKMDFNKQKYDFHYAIHPGGPKILSHIEEVLNLKPDNFKLSQQVFYRLGNMSSATLPHIWKAIIEEPSIEVGKKIITIAFGPGLTATGFIMEKV